MNKTARDRFNARVAVELMRWERLDKMWTEPEPSGVLGYRHMVPRCRVADWNPWQNHAQAREVLQYLLSRPI